MAVLGWVPPGGTSGAVYVPTYTNRDTAAGGVLDALDGAAAAVRGAAVTMAAAPRRGMNSLRVRPDED
jgi:hypothetical protein